MHVMHQQERRLLSHILNDKSTNVLALFHLTCQLTITGIASLRGAEQGLEMARRFRPSWWIANHDDTYNLSGLLYYLFTKLKMTLEDALRMEAKRDDKPERDLEGTSFADIPAGGAIALV